MAVGIVILFAAAHPWMPLAGFLLIGLGCAPVYPCIIPGLFGAERSQAVVGIEMASAYVGTLAMPPLFGLIAQETTTRLLPAYLGIILVVMYFAYSALLRMKKSEPA